MDDSVMRDVVSRAVTAQSGEASSSFTFSPGITFDSAVAFAAGGDQSLRMPMAQQGQVEEGSSADASADASHGVRDSETHERVEDIGPSFESLDDALTHIGFGQWQLLLLLYAGLAWMADAMEVMLLSYVGPSVRCEWGLGPESESLLTSVVFLGMMFGACTWGAVADVRGRRPAFFATSSFTAILGLLSAVAPNFPVLLLLRCLVGVGLAGVPAVYTTLLEWLPPQHRGRWLVLFNLWWTLGTLLEALLAWVVLGSLGWRALLGLSALPLAALLAAYPWLPESPRYLLTAGRPGEALQLLRRAAAANGKAPPASVGAAQADPVGRRQRRQHQQVCVVVARGLHAPLARPQPALSLFQVGGNGGGRGGGGRHWQNLNGATPGRDSHGDRTGTVNSSLAGGWQPLCAPSSLPATPHRLSDEGSAGMPSPEATRRPLISPAQGLSRSRRSTSGSSSVDGSWLEPSGRGGGSGGVRCRAGPGSSTRHRRPAGRLQQLWEPFNRTTRDALGILRRIFSRRLRRTTWLLLVTWFASATSYYGVILLTTELSLHKQGDKGSSSGASSGGLPAECVPGSGTLPLRGADVLAVVVSASAEFPSILVCAAAIDTMGRRATVAGGMLLTGAGLLPLMARALRTGAALLPCLFAARFGIMAAYSALYIYTPELYPTSVRTAGLGFCNAVSRIGGLVSPFIAVDLVERGMGNMAALVLSILCFAAAATTAAQYVETAGAALEVVASEGEGMTPRSHNDIASSHRLVTDGDDGDERAENDVCRRDSRLVDERYLVQDVQHTPRSAAGHSLV